MDSNFAIKFLNRLRQQYQEWSQPIPPPSWRQIGFIVLGGVLLTPLLYQLPLLGYDWHRLFQAGVLDQYPPWMVPLFAPFRVLPWRWSLALVNSLTLVCLAFITRHQSQKSIWDGLLAVLLVLVSPPLWYLLWDGQIDGLITAGLLFLPWSTPLVLLRPQILGWLLLARKRWTIGMAIWLSVSFLCWGWWLPETLRRSQGSIGHPTAMGWATLGWPIMFVGLWMLLNARGDSWRLLAAAFVASPYVQPYHMVMLLPTLGRVQGWKRWILWGWVWVVGLVPAFMGITRYLALGFPVAVWWFLREPIQDAFLKPPGTLRE